MESQATNAPEVGDVEPVQTTPDSEPPTTELPDDNVTEQLKPLELPDPVTALKRSKLDYVGVFGLNIPESVKDRLFRELASEFDKKFYSEICPPMFDVQSGAFHMVNEDFKYAELGANNRQILIMTAFHLFPRIGYSDHARALLQKGFPEDIMRHAIYSAETIPPEYSTVVEMNTENWIAVYADLRKSITETAIFPKKAIRRLYDNISKTCNSRIWIYCASAPDLYRAFRADIAEVKQTGEVLEVIEPPYAVMLMFAMDFGMSMSEILKDAIAETEITVLHPAPLLVNLMKQNLTKELETPDKRDRAEVELCIDLIAKLADRVAGLELWTGAKEYANRRRERILDEVEQSSGVRPPMPEFEVTSEDLILFTFANFTGVMA